MRIICQVITLIVFTAFTLIFFREGFPYNYEYILIPVYNFYCIVQ